MYKAKKRKLSNQARILECVYRNAPVARTEIADMTQITPATVTANVTALIGEGVLTELGEVFPEENTSGRKRVLLDLCPSWGYSLGAEFTQKALVACVTDMKGQVVASLEKPFSQDLADHVTEEIINGLNGLVEKAHIPWSQVVGLGIAVPGHMDQAQANLITNRTTWASFSPRRIREAFPLPVAFENNARCMALGQYLFHPKESPDSFALFHVGLGMFCASIQEGELFLGNNYVAGEIGHTIVNEGGRRCECGKYGCLQTYASENWLLKHARLLYENCPSTMLRNLAASKEGLAIQQVTTAYSMGDPMVAGYIGEALKYLGVTISNIAIIMNPSKIFLHGKLFDNQDVCRELMDYIDRQLLFVGGDPVEDIQILPFDLLDGAVGASGLAVSRFFIP